MNDVVRSPAAMTARQMDRRKLALLHRRTPPPELDLGIDYVVDGSSELVAAHAVGLTKEEWEYCKYLGHAGHQAYEEFFRCLLQAKARVGRQVHSRILQKGVEEGDLAALGMSARIQGIEDGQEVTRRSSDGRAGNFGELAITFRSFSNSEVVEAEDAEVVG